MKFPENNRQLDEIFAKAKVPEVSEFDGTYAVDMLTTLPSLKRFLHRKVFYHKHGTVLGYNTIFKNKKWGRFFLETGTCEELDFLNVVVIDYKQHGNSFFTNKIKDHVRCVEKSNIYLGRFNYFFMGKYRFLGYFSLIKISLQ